MTNPVGICSYCRIDPNAPSVRLFVQSARALATPIVSVLLLVLTHKQRKGVGKMSKPKTMRNNAVSENEWTRIENLVSRNLDRLAKAGLIESDELEYEYFDYYDKYQAESEISKFVSSRLPWVD
jgi:hypothetical protein